jgi:tetratricopeptide (TPR) repeat protein
MMAGGMEMVEIMQRKFKASDLNDQGVRFYQQGKISEALSSLQEALTVNPMHEKAHENLGGILLQLGRLEEARNVLEKLLSINPRREDGRRYMAEVKSKLDRRTVKQVPLPSQSSPATAIAAQKPSRKWYQFWQ